jgi:hypothetical protein
VCRPAHAVQHGSDLIAGSGEDDSDLPRPREIGVADRRRGSARRALC